jgi:hypothetical protein
MQNSLLVGETYSLMNGSFFLLGARLREFLWVSGRQERFLEPVNVNFRGWRSPRTILGARQREF